MANLRILILLNKSEKRSWKLKIVDELLNFRKFETIGIFEIEPKYTTVQKLKKAIFELRFFFFRLAFAIERLYFAKRVNYTVQHYSANKCPVKLFRKNGDYYFKEKNLYEIKKHKIDFIINLSEYHYIKNLSHIISKGIIYYRYSQVNFKDRLISGFWELLSNHGELSGEMILQSKSKEEVISSTFSYLHKLSVFKSLENHFWKSANYFVKELDKYIIKTSKEGYSFPPPKKQKEMTFSEIFRLNFRLYLYYINQALFVLKKKYKKNKWFLLYLQLKNINEIFEINISELNILEQPKNIDRADPFVSKMKDLYYLFYEETEPNSQKGHLSVSIFDSNIQKPNLLSKKILTKSYHLSFPNIIKTNGDFFMIPESEANKTISIYKFNEFPYKLSFVKNIFENIEATDTIVYFYNDLWWLFCNIKKEHMLYNYDELHLFYSDDLLSDNWKTHPLNPVISDVKSARNAGQIFSVDGKIYRPSQNCRYRYGYGVNINEIIKLTTDNYEEKIVKSYYPYKAGFENIHTLNILDNFVFMDAK